jgi:hypothetical protein
VFGDGILASRNKAKALNIAKKDLGQAPWEKIKVPWREIALTKLQINPDDCPKCKSGFMEVTKVISPLRSPPVFQLKANLKFLQE